MIFPGHLAGGYLAARAVLEIVQPHLTAGQLNWLLFAGVFFGIAPDFDWARSFISARSFMVANPDRHRKFFTHMPAYWLIASVVVFFAAPSVFGRCIAVMMLAGSWSHFALDSLDLGILWLWPFSSKLYAFRKTSAIVNWSNRKFWDYWTTMIFSQESNLRLSFYCEIAISLVGLGVFLWRL